MFTNKYYDDQIGNQTIIENWIKNMGGGNNGTQPIVGNTAPVQDPNSDAWFTPINPNYMDFKKYLVLGNIA